MKYIFRQEFFKLIKVQMEYWDIDENFGYICMQYDDKENCWYCESDINIVRYKYIVNDIIRLNDPNASKYIIGDRGEVWSFPNSKNAKIENSINVCSYSISNSIENNRKEFYYGQMSEMYFNIELSRIKGIHCLTYMCFQPDGMIFHLEESCISTEDFSDAKICFKSNISKLDIKYALGIWSVQVYLDGNCIVKDYFSLNKKTIYRLPYLDYKM